MRFATERTPTSVPVSRTDASGKMRHCPRSMARSARTGQENRRKERGNHAGEPGRVTPAGSGHAGKRQSQGLAVLIDAGNTSARHAHAIFEEIVKLGEANVRRIYGDFSGTRLAGWDKQIQSLAILQHQQRSNTTGKNASDIAFVIDAMDLMHKGNREVQCHQGPGW